MISFGSAPLINYRVAMADGWTPVNRTPERMEIRFSTKEEDGQRTSFGNLPGEDASFEQLYSLQRIELTKKLRENHGRDKS